MPIHIKKKNGTGYDEVKVSNNEVVIVSTDTNLIVQTSPKPKDS